MQNRPVIHEIEPAGEQAADTVMLLMLSLARRREGGAPTIAGRTLGLVGFDDAAKAVARRAAQGFGMRVLVYGALGEQRALVRQLGAAISPSLSDLLGESDFVSLHGRPGDGAFVNAHRLNQMKPDACLINAAHGELMDEQDLVHALWFETIGGAGIAVPPDTLDRLKDLEACDNAVILPLAGEAARSVGISRRPQAASNVIPMFERRRHLG